MTSLDASLDRQFAENPDTLPADMPKKPRDAEGRMAATEYNRLAGRMLTRARRHAPERFRRQEDFAPEVSRVLGTSIVQSTLSGYESGARQVPAAVLLAAAAVSGLGLSAMREEEDAEDGMSRRVDTAFSRIAEALEVLAGGSAEAVSEEQKRRVLEAAKDIREILSPTD